MHDGDNGERTSAAACISGDHFYEPRFLLKIIIIFFNRETSGKGDEIKWRGGGGGG